MRGYGGGRAGSGGPVRECRFEVFGSGDPVWGVRIEWASSGRPDPTYPSSPTRPRLLPDVT